MDFSQFLNFLQNLWVIKADIKVNKCNQRIQNNMKIFKLVFDFLDGGETKDL